MNVSAACGPGTRRAVAPAGKPTQALVGMERGLMFVTAISDGSSLSVEAAPECETDLVSYERTLLVDAVGDILTPAARTPGA